MKLYRAGLLRSLVLPVFKYLNPGDISIRHHYSGKKIRLHSFRHKGYWFHGRNRERETMESFEKLLENGDCVFEVGGHIGYLTQLFAKLVGKTGKVIVFEPGENNLPYLAANTAELPTVEIVKKAISDVDGVLNFYEDDLTGQNNSLLSDYSVLRQNVSSAHVHVNIMQKEVLATTLDSFVLESSTLPTLVKIDIEGAEILALRGMRRLATSQQPTVMVEVTENVRDVWQWKLDLDYKAFTPSGQEILNNEQMYGNVFLVHSSRVQSFLDRIKVENG